MSIVSFSQAIEDLRHNKPIIIIDDEARENEGDLVMPIATASQEWVNFFITHARGLLCTPISTAIADQCGLSLMPKSASLPEHSCNFLISVDAAQHITTGISAGDRWYTMRQFVDPNVSATDFITPGHSFPLLAHEDGLFQRKGHTEASLALCRYLGVPEVAMICEIINDDGTMARLDDLKQFAAKHSFSIVTIEEIYNALVAITSLLLVFLKNYRHLLLLFLH